MCLSIPGKIKSLNDDLAVVDINGVETEANVSMLDNPQVDDWVLVHTGFAIQKYSREEAQETLAMVKEVVGLD